MDDPRLGDLDEALFDLDPAEATPLQRRRGAGRAAAHERVEDEPAVGAGEPDQPAKELDRLQGRMGVAGRGAPAGVRQEVERLRSQLAISGGQGETNTDADSGQERQPFWDKLFRRK